MPGNRMVDKMVAYARKEDALRALARPPEEKPVSPGDRFIDDLVQYNLEEVALENLAHPWPREFEVKTDEALGLFESVVGRLPTVTEVGALNTDERWRTELLLALAQANAPPPMAEHVGGYRQLASTVTPPPAPSRRRWWHFWRR